MVEINGKDHIIVKDKDNNSNIIDKIPIDINLSDYSSNKNNNWFPLSMDKTCPETFFFFMILKARSALLLV